jgi:D-alanine transaminase
MAKMQALAAGCDDAWLVEDGMVTEGTSNNAHILTADGRIVTRRPSHAILSGITRAAMLKLAEQERLTIEERSFSVEEAQAAQEAFITSATSLVLPVVEIGGRPVGSGKPGPMAAKLRALYIEQALGRT